MHQEKVRHVTQASSGGGEWSQCAIARRVSPCSAWWNRIPGSCTICVIVEVRGGVIISHNSIHNSTHGTTTITMH